MGFAPAKSNPYAKGKRKSRRRCAIWSEAVWASLVKLATHGLDDWNSPLRQLIREANALE